MKRKLIIDGNAVYEIDEECMVRRCLSKGEELQDTVSRQEKKDGEKSQTDK